MLAVNVRVASGLNRPKKKNTLKATAKVRKHQANDTATNCEASELLFSNQYAGQRRLTFPVPDRETHL